MCSPEKKKQMIKNSNLFRVRSWYYWCFGSLDASKKSMVGRGANEIIVTWLLRFQHT